VTPQRRLKTSLGEKQMGRPLHKKYFGNRNIGSTTTTADDKIGGEGVASVVVTGTFSGKTTATDYAIPASVISSPDLPDGIKPTLTIRFSSATAGAVTVVDKGSGYSAAPTISGAALQALGGGAGTVVLTAALTVSTGFVGSATNQENAISITAWVPATGAAGNISGNGTSAVVGDIRRQVGSKKYVVETAQGVGRVTLVAATPATGQATIIATDSASNTYYVTKLTAHKAKLSRLSGSSYLYATGQTANWSFATASGAIVQIANA